MKNAANRPLSPHLTVYKLPMVAIMSIMHRGTGVALAIGSLLVTWWLVALASGAESFTAANDFLGSWFGILLLFGWSWALFYHLCTGIRHLLWDTGFGFDLATTHLTGKIVVAVSLVLTILVWLIA